MRDAGALGIVVYTLAFVVAAVCLLPGSILTVGAGVAFGLVWGTVIASGASALAAIAAFFVARSAGRVRVARWVARDRRLDALDAAIGERGLPLVILVRLSPLIPFNLLNYALGLTTVRLRDYTLGTIVGMLPVTVLYVYVGSLAGQLVSLARGAEAGRPLRLALLATGLTATLAATIWITRLARRALDDALTTVAPADDATRVPELAPKSVHRRSGAAEV
jgi:uncharacterized membrane protein YdjX (TVP38/TMEM64 family)